MSGKVLLCHVIRMVVLSACFSPISSTFPRIMKDLGLLNQSISEINSRIEEIKISMNRQTFNENQKQYIERIVKYIVDKTLRFDSNIKSLVKGDKGTKGEAGLRGAVGFRGITGQKGDKGDVGATFGVVGAQGKKGDKGEPGKDGMPGLAGVNIVGDRGPPGDTGIGLVGPTGSTGAPGAKGFKGDKGEKGESGSAGPRGLPGKPGASGKPGVKGNVGTKGQKGESALLSVDDVYKLKSALHLKGDKGEHGQRGAKGECVFLNASSVRDSRKLSRFEDKASFVDFINFLVQGGKIKDEIKLKKYLFSDTSTYTQDTIDNVLKFVHTVDNAVEGSDGHNMEGMKVIWQQLKDVVNASLQIQDSLLGSKEYLAKILSPLNDVINVSVSFPDIIYQNSMMYNLSSTRFSTDTKFYRRVLDLFHSINSTLYSLPQELSEPMRTFISNTTIISSLLADGLLFIKNLNNTIVIQNELNRKFWNHIIMGGNGTMSNNIFDGILDGLAKIFEKVYRVIMVDVVDPILKALIRFFFEVLNDQVSVLVPVVIDVISSVIPVFERVLELVLQLLKYLFCLVVRILLIIDDNVMFFEYILIYLLISYFLFSNPLNSLILIFLLVIILGYSRYYPSILHYIISEDLKSCNISVCMMRNHSLMYNLIGVFINATDSPKRPLMPEINFEFQDLPNRPV